MWPAADRNKVLCAYITTCAVCLVLYTTTTISGNYELPRYAISTTLLFLPLKRPHNSGQYQFRHQYIFTYHQASNIKVHSPYLSSFYEETDHVTIQKIEANHLLGQT